MKLVPTIDISKYKNGTLDEASIKSLDAACRDHGFFLLSGHGMDDLVSDMWREAAAFFGSSQALKDAVRRTEANPFGYYDRELTKQKRDLKEVFDFKAGGYVSSRSKKHTPWPSELPEFKRTMSEYFQACTDLAETTISLVYSTLGLPTEQVKSDFGDIHTSTMRLNYYPVDDPLSAQDKQSVNALGDMALHHHTDPGAITLLMQDNTGGLQALSNEDGWIDVPPGNGTFVVNLGDTLQVQTNDQYKAAVHRVLPMTKQGRYSTPFFYQPRFDAEIKPMDALRLGNPKYQSFSWRDYIKGRVDDNYADIGEDDIQIARYKIE